MSGNDKPPLSNELSLSFIDVSPDDVDQVLDDKPSLYDDTLKAGHKGKIPESKSDQTIRQALFDDNTTSDNDVSDELMAKTANFQAELDALTPEELEEISRNGLTTQQRKQDMLSQRERELTASAEDTESVQITPDTTVDFEPE